MGLWLCAKRYRTLIDLVPVPVSIFMSALCGCENSVAKLKGQNVNFLIVHSARLLYLAAPDLAAAQNVSLEQWHVRLRTLERKLNVLMFPLRVVEETFEKKCSYFKHAVDAQLTAPTALITDLTKWLKQSESKQLSLLTNIRANMAKQLATREWNGGTHHLVIKGADGSNSNLVFQIILKHVNSVVAPPRLSARSTPAPTSAPKGKISTVKKTVTVSNENELIQAMRSAVQCCADLNQSGVLIQPFIPSLSTKEMRTFFDVTDPLKPLHLYTILTRSKNSKVFAADHVFRYESSHLSIRFPQG